MSGTSQTLPRICGSITLSPRLSKKYLTLTLPLRVS